MNEKRNTQKREYNKEHYDTLVVRVPAGQRDKIKQFATDNSETLNQYVNRLVREDIEKYGE